MDPELHFWGTIRGRNLRQTFPGATPGLPPAPWGWWLSCTEPQSLIPLNKTENSGWQNILSWKLPIRTIKARPEFNPVQKWQWKLRFSSRFGKKKNPTHNKIRLMLNGNYFALQKQLQNNHQQLWLWQQLTSDFWITGVVWEKLEKIS